MAKQNLERLIPYLDDTIVCAENAPCSGVTTLCGFTDGGEFVETSRPITCPVCLGIIRFIHQHRKPRNA